ncbi:MAG: PspA/IM30 family protein [Myxococcales bacterium]|nr:PspA/IM30 family protein [Myxococcales bacterium]
MGIFSRLNNVVRANVSGMLDKAEDPESLINQTIREMESGLKQAHQELVETLGHAKRLEQEAEEARAEVAKWEQRATLAVRKGEDSLARDALKQKLQASKKAERLDGQAAQNHSAVDKMKDTLDSIEHKIEELRAKKAALASQVRAAREAGTGTSSGGLGGGSAFDGLERLTHKVDQLEAEVEASSVLDDTKKAELEARFRDLEKSSEAFEVEDELAALKRKVEGG